MTHTQAPGQNSEPAPHVHAHIWPDGTATCPLADERTPHAAHTLGYWFDWDVHETYDCAGLCGAQYGKNPDLCHQPAEHGGRTHTNRYGTTWPI